MFRFFRQLRKKGIGDGRVRRYMFYAIGEVALVVIGILLALQIDAWNTARVDRKKEILYLKEIRTNLKDDLNNVEYSIAFNREKDSVITASLNAMLDAGSSLEAMLGISRNMPILAEFSVYTQNRVAFDNMLSAENIDLISEDSMRTELSAYYSEQNLLDGTQERVKQLTRIFVDNITPSLMNRENITQFFKDNNFDSANDLDFTTNRVLFGDLFGMQKNLVSHTLYLEAYQRQIQALIAQIDTFLSRTN